MMQAELGLVGPWLAQKQKPIARDGFFLQALDGLSIDYLSTNARSTT